MLPYINRQLFINIYRFWQIYKIAKQINLILVVFSLLRMYVNIKKIIPNLKGILYTARYTELRRYWHLQLLTFGEKKYNNIISLKILSILQIK